MKINQKIQALIIRLVIISKKWAPHKSKKVVKKERIPKQEVERVPKNKLVYFNFLINKKCQIWKVWKNLKWTNQINFIKFLSNKNKNKMNKAKLFKKWILNFKITFK